MTGWPTRRPLVVPAPLRSHRRRGPDPPSAVTGACFAPDTDGYPHLMERGSSKHGPRMDDELEREAVEAARPNPSVRGDQWPDPEDPTNLHGARASATEDVEPRTDADFLPQGDPGTGSI